MRNDEKDFASLLRLYQERQGFSRDTLAEKIDVEAGTIRRWEKGEARPTLRRLFRLANVLNLSQEEYAKFLQATGISVNTPPLDTVRAIQNSVERVAEANPKNIQEVAAAQAEIINSYYLNGLEQSKKSFFWSLIWGGIGSGFLLGAVSVLLFRQPTEIAYASGIGGVLVEMFAGTYLYIYKHASDQLATYRLALENMQKILLANSMCEGLDTEAKQSARIELIRLVVTSATQLDMSSSGLQKSNGSAS